jgi:hypothetical protein
MPGGEGGRAARVHRKERSESTQIGQPISNALGRGVQPAVIALDRVPDLIERPLIGVGKLRISWKIKMILHI